MNKNPLNYAFFLLKIRDRSRGEIESKMRQKKFAPEKIKKTLKTLLDSGLVNDKKFAQNIISNSLLYKNEGKNKIKINLIKRFIPSDIVDHFIDQISRDDEMKSARRATEKWYGKSSKKDKNWRNRTLGHLSRKGFSYDIIREMMDEFES